VALLIPRPFADNVENGFQTAAALRDFVHGQIRTSFGAALDKTFLMAHSLGSQVAMDAMRLHQVSSPGGKLVRALTLVEPAFWSEMCWPAADVTYSDDTSTAGIYEGITYSPDALRRNSWCFYFNQPPYRPRDSVDVLINSRNRDDFALWIMVCDDIFVRNGHLDDPGPHYDRPAPPDYRLAVPALGASDPAWDHDESRNLAHQIPAMLQTGPRLDSNGNVAGNHRRTNYAPDDLQPPQGQIDMDASMGAVPIDAMVDGDWDKYSHNGHKGGEDADIDAFMDDLRRDDATILDLRHFNDDKFPTPLAQVWKWFVKVQGDGAYTIKREK
jgi:pimeloyl-ACP methyl ester carboxylesterase